MWRQTCCFLYMAITDGNPRPPFRGERNRSEVFAERVSPDFFLRKRVARGWITFLKKEMRNVSMSRGHVRRGHTPCLYRRSFWLCVTGTASMARSTVSRDFFGELLAAAGSGGTQISLPRNLKGASPTG